MMSIISRFSTSLFTLLDDSASVSKAEDRIEDIRSAMLECLAECLDETESRPALWNELTEATCIQTLWYLRIDLMAFLSFCFGETLASQRLVLITDRFRGGLAISTERRKIMTVPRFYFILICIDAVLLWQRAWP
jgi:hypothetical protein